MPYAQVPTGKSRFGAVAARWAAGRSSEAAFEALAALAARICVAPYGIVVVVTGGNRYVKAAVGFPGGAISRVPRFCEETLARREMVDVPDALEDDRFHGDALVRGRTRVRSYLGVPLLRSDGVPLGVLGIMDSETRMFEPAQRNLLEQLGTIAADTIETHASAPRDVPHQLDLISTAAETAHEAVAIMESVAETPEDARITYANDVFLSLFGYTRDEVVGKSPAVLYGSETDKRVVRKIVAAMGDALPLHGELTCYRSDGARVLIDFTMTPLQSELEAERSVVVVSRDVTEARRTQEELRTLWAAVKEADDGVCVYRCSPDRSWRVVYVNDAMSRMTEYSREHLLQDADLELLSGDRTNREELQRFFAEVRTGRSSRVELQLYKSNGELFWGEFVARPMPGTEPPVCVAVVRDITGRRRDEERIRLLTEALEQASDMIAILAVPDNAQDPWRIVYVNGAFEQYTGYRRDELIGHTLAPLIHRSEDFDNLADMRTPVTHEERAGAEMRFTRKDGTELWVEAAPQRIVGPDGKATHMIVAYRDVTVRKQMQEALSYEAAHDPLTGLHNRRYFDRALERALNDMRRTSMPHCLALMDLDEFKPINDVFGHDAGDAMLKEVALTLSRQIRHGDVLARIGGDEFAVIFHECNLESAARISEVLLRQVQSCSIDWNSHALRVGASVGLVPINATFSSIARLLKSADELCYTAKRAGRNRVAVYSREEARRSPSVF